MSLYFCSQEPKRDWRTIYASTVKIVEADSRAAALREFSDARDDQDGYGRVDRFAGNRWKAPQAVPLQIGAEYLL